MSLSENQTKPGSFVTIFITSTSNTTIYLSASKWNEKHYEDGLEILQSLRRHYDPSNKTRYPDFTNSNAIILTNADEVTYQCSSSRSFSEAVTTLTEINYSLTETPTPKGKLITTWLSKNFSVQANDRLNISLEVPSFITKWIISGFTMNTQSGFRILKPLTLNVRDSNA